MGGMGVIYKAMQEPLNRIVALKVLLPLTSRNEESSKRFELEAKAISLLQHQNIVNIYEYGEEGEYRFFAMQFVDGEDLAKKIQRRKNMSYTEIIDISKQICRGLRYAHSKSVIHRDIKPQNVLIDKGGVALLSDFGIAKIFSSTHLTLTGVTVGTPEYMSPEQAEGRTLDQQTDIYSLGIMMYEMVAREPPFTGENPVSIAYKQVHETPIPPSVRRKDIPKRLELIILKALKKEKRDRYGSAEEMLEHLDSVDLDERVERPTLSFTNRREETEHVLDKRITDRRSGDRRRGRAGRGASGRSAGSLLDLEYWIEMVRSQWLALLLGGGVGIAFIAHLLLMH